jgi:flagellar L-ring protein precursor FlgH
MNLTPSTTLAASLLLAGSAAAQSLMQPPPAAEASVLGGDTAVSELEQMSPIAIKPPKPREFKLHDLVTIVIEETSRQQAEQSLKTDKKYNNDSTLGTIIDPWELLEFRLRAGDTSNLKLLGIDNKSKFDGKGSFERNDRLQMKIQATIIDIKPNGVLVLEARKFINKNGETQETILAGSARQEDITGNNTVFSSQLANLSLATHNTGDVNRAGQKGLIPRVLETLFAF